MFILLNEIVIYRNIFALKNIEEMYISQYNSSKKASTRGIIWLYAGVIELIIALVRRNKEKNSK